jgi:hypothetical protein
MTGGKEGEVVLSGGPWLVWIEGMQFLVGGFGSMG